LKGCEKLDESKNVVVEEKPKRIVSLKGKTEAVSDAKVTMKISDEDLVKKEMVKLESGEYHFGKPKLKHRDVIIKIWKKLTTASINYEGAQEVMEVRGLKNIEELAAIPEGEFTPEEVALLMKGIGGDQNLEDIISVMSDALYITLRKAPWPIEKQSDIDDNLDFDESLVLAKNAILWIKETVISQAERKNLQRLSSQESPQ